MLKQRIITALIVTLLIGIGILYLPTKGVAILFALLLLIAAWEWADLAGLVHTTTKLIYATVCALLILVVATYSELFFPGSPLYGIAIEPVWDILILSCLWWSIAWFWVIGFPASASIWGAVPMRCLMGFFILVPTWLALIFLHIQPNGVALIVLLIALVACADIGAYFCGRIWGKARLIPTVSPGKTWAGLWGGLAISGLFIMIVWLFWGRNIIDFAPMMAIGMTTALVSVLGDLFESMVKRYRGVKDSGTLLPGHGGMMDRLDSMTAASPVFAMGLLWVGV